MNLPEIKIIDNSASRRRIETKSGSIGHCPQRRLNFEQKFSHLVIRLGTASIPPPNPPGVGVFQSTATLMPVKMKALIQCVRGDKLRVKPGYPETLF